MSFIQLDLAGVDETTEWFEGIEARGEDSAPILAVFQESFFSLEREKFRLEGPGWAPLKPGTLATKLALGAPADILVRNANLMESLTSVSPYTEVVEVSTASEAVLSITANPLDDWGRSYAGYHMTGFKDKGGGSVPARPPIAISQAAAQIWADALIEWVATGDIEAAAGIADFGSQSVFAI